MPLHLPMGEYKIDLEKLSISLNSYACFLEDANKTQKARQSLMHPVLVVGDHSFLEHRHDVQSVNPRYSVLDNIMTARENFSYILFDEDSHLQTPFKQRKDRYDLKKRWSCQYHVRC